MRACVIGPSGEQIAWAALLDGAVMGLGAVLLTSTLLLAADGLAVMPLVIVAVVVAHVVIAHLTLAPARAEPTPPVRAPAAADCIRFG